MELCYKKKKNGGRGWETEWWEKNRSIFNFLHGRNVQALISSTWNSKQRWQRWAVLYSYSSPSPATSPVFPRNSRSLLPLLFPSTPRSSRSPVKSICPSPGSSISTTVSASHSPALTVISMPSSFHFPYPPTSHAQPCHFFSHWECNSLNWSNKNRKKGIRLASSLYAQQAPFRMEVPTGREISNPAFELRPRCKISPAVPHVLASFHAHSLHTCYCYVGQVAIVREETEWQWWWFNMWRPTIFRENGRNSSVFQKHFKFMFHLALPRTLSRCLTRPPVQRASFANLNKF